MTIRFDESAPYEVEERDATPDQRAIREVNAGLYALDAEFLRGGIESQLSASTNPHSRW